MTLAEKVAFLKRPASYPRGTGAVSVCETHTACVFLTDDHAYKIKKPVDLSFLDFTSLKDRKHFCEEEIRLNRQLAGDKIYLGTVPITCDDHCNLKIGDGGRVVDWMVEMLRLPESEMLDNRLAAHQHVSLNEVEALADVLAGFYMRQQSSERDSEPYTWHLKQESVKNAHHLHRMRDFLGEDYSNQLCNEALAAIDVCLPEIRNRMDAGLVVEGHGDLRPEHVCLLSPPVVFDRLEFDPEMLLIDIYDEVNYLGLECESMGAPWIGNMLLRRLESTFGSPPSHRLLHAYGAFRALLRARLSIDHLLDENPCTPQKWPDQARRYLRAARLQLNGEKQLPAAI